MVCLFADLQSLTDLAVLASCGVEVSAGAGADKEEAPKPLPPEIVETWRDAGAAVGWMKKDLRAGIYRLAL